MNKAQKARLKALLAIAPESLTAQDKASLKKLQDLALKHAYKAEDDKETAAAIGTIADDGDDSEPTAMDDAQVKGIVIAALTEAGLNVDNIAAAVRAKSPAGLTRESVTEAVKEQVKGLGVNTDELVAKVAAKFPAAVTLEQVRNEFAEAVKGLKSPSRMEHGLDISHPISHRNGNLTVAAKQLLNLCMMNVSEEAIDNTRKNTPNYKRPKDMNDGITDTILADAEARGYRQVKTIEQDARLGFKAITTTGAGTGLELMNVTISHDIQTRLYLASQLAADFVGSEIDMPSNPFPLPLTTTRTQFFVGSEGGAQQSSTPGTGQIILNARKLIGWTDYSYEADEDSIVAILPMMQTQMGAGAAESLESAIINGDVSGTHMDSDINAVPNACQKLFKGLRKYALTAGLGVNTVSLAAGGITTANVKGLRKLLGKYSMNPRDLVIISGINGYNELVGLPETLTANLVGAQARILTGVAPSIFGMTILPSSQCREDLNASGVYDGVTTTKGSVFIAHRPSWLMGVRRQFTIEVFRDPRIQLNTVIASFRRDMKPVEATGATVPNLVMGYNYTP